MSSISDVLGLVMEHGAQSDRVLALSKKDLVRLASTCKDAKAGVAEVMAGGFVCPVDTVMRRAFLPSIPKGRKPDDAPFIIKVSNRNDIFAKVEVNRHYVSAGIIASCRGYFKDIPKGPSAISRTTAAVMRLTTIAYVRKGVVNVVFSENEYVHVCNIDVEFVDALHGKFTASSPQP